MISEDEHFKISDILSLMDKGKNMTLSEKENLDDMMKMMQETYGYLDSQNKYELFNMEQRAFVKNILYFYLKQKGPKLYEVLAIYNLDINTIFVWKDIYLGMSP